MTAHELGTTLQSPLGDLDVRDAIVSQGVELPDYQATVAYIHQKAEKQALNSGQTKKIAGDLWESLVVAFLQTDPVWQRQLAKVYRPGGFDKGVDIIVEGHDGKVCAVQCKFSGNPDASLSKSQIDSFLGALNSKKYDEGMVVWSGFKVSKAVDDEIGPDAKTPVKLLTGYNLSAAAVNWTEIAATDRVVARQPKTPFEHQEKAVVDLLVEFTGKNEQPASSKAKLVMACGSGKTFTSQLAAELIAGADKLIAYFVPSLALMGQTMRSWAQDEDPDRYGVQHKFCGICSDAGVGKMAEEGMERQAIAQLEMPIATDVASIEKMLTKPIPQGHMRTVFCTYDSAARLAEAMAETGTVFDLLFCDEAHRTTGIERFSESAKKKDMSGWQMPTEDTHIPARKRVFMTATPKVFSKAAKDTAAQQERKVWDMGDPEIYGNTAFTLGFSTVVDKKLLSDYKVEIIQTRQGLVQDLLNKFWESPRAQTIDEKTRKSLDTGAAAQMVGLFKALTGGCEEGGILWKTIVYTNRIDASKAFAALFPLFSEHLAAVAGKDVPRIAVEHVDGTMPATTRQRKLAFLDEAAIAGEIRILSNPDCLSEGVDVPTLDALCFLQPKGSTIKIVQSVGRVMRKAPLKKYGHVIVPTIIPAEVEDYTQYLRRDDHWKTTWALLRALRSHDDRLADELAKHELNSDYWPQQIRCHVVKDDLDTLLIAGSGKSGVAGGGAGAETEQGDKDRSGNKSDDGSEIDSGDSDGEWSGAGSGTRQPALNGGDGDVEILTLDFENLLVEVPQEAYKLLLQGLSVVTLEKVGERQYWEVWSKDAAVAYERILERITSYYQQNQEFKGEIDRTVKDLKTTIGDRSTPEEILSILAQFQVIRPVFNALFGTSEYFEDSPLSAAMTDLADSVEILNLDAETHKLDSFYDSVVKRAEAIDRPEDRQELIKHLYEDFIGTAFPEEKRKYGVVYTPTEIVDFILRSVDWSLKEELGIADGIASENVEVLDPFAGTGTFLVRLIQNPDLLPDDKLEHKFRHNLHSNEIMALPYWATEVNMEQAYQTRMPGEYVPYENGVLVDTFTMAQPGSDQTALKFGSRATRENYERATRQDNKKITVIVGNPPWKMVEDNAEKEISVKKEYPYVCECIEETYGKFAKKVKKMALFDSYIMALRWASDRIGEHGVIGFVTNNGWLTGAAASGVRRVIEDEFAFAHVINLRGKIQNVPLEQKALEGANVFGVTVGVQIIILSKTAERKQNEKAKIRYHDIVAISDASQKLGRLTQSQNIADPNKVLQWEILQCDKAGDWLEQGTVDWGQHSIMGDEDTKKFYSGEAMFGLYSNGLKSQMDYIALSSDAEVACGNGELMAKEFNSHILNDTTPFESETKDQPFKWYKGMKDRLASHKQRDEFIQFTEEDIKSVQAKPFLPQIAVWHKKLNWSQYRLNDMFTTQSGVDLEGIRSAASAASRAQRAERSEQFASRVSGMLSSTAPSPASRQTCTSTTEPLSASPDIVSRQLAISAAGVGTATGFRAIAHLLPPDLSLVEKTQCFPRYRLESPPESSLGGGFEATADGNGVLHGQDCGDGTGRVWIDNILDSTLERYRAHYENDTIVKDDIFFYVYGILHHEGYRAKYKNDLKKELPRIPTAPNFRKFSEIGKSLAELHCDYDQLKGWDDGKLKWELSDEAKDYLALPLDQRPFIDEQDPKTDAWLNPFYCEKKMRWTDNGATLKINNHITLQKIPPGAHTYKLAGKSPLEIFAKEYYRKADKKTGIVNDRNLLFADNTENLLLRIRQLIQVGVETTQLLAELPTEFE